MSTPTQERPRRSWGELSPASSSPIRGTAAWPNGQDVELKYDQSEFGEELVRANLRLVSFDPVGCCFLLGELDALKDAQADPCQSQQSDDR